MKIKLSKSQWQFIGKKTGWIKTAANPVEITIYKSLIEDPPWYASSKIDNRYNPVIVAVYGWVSSDDYDIDRVIDLETNRDITKIIDSDLRKYLAKAYVKEIQSRAY